MPDAVIAAARGDHRRRAGIALAIASVIASAAATMPAAILGYGLVLGLTLVALALVDLAERRLPDLLTLPLVLAGLGASFVMPDGDPRAHLIGAMLGYAVPVAIAFGYRAWRGIDGLGMGDAKLLAAGGAWLGWAALPSVLVIAALSGIAWFGALRAGGRDDREIPFGVPLAGAIWLIWLIGPLSL